MIAQTMQRKHALCIVLPVVDLLSLRRRLCFCIGLSVGWLVSRISTLKVLDEYSLNFEWWASSGRCTLHCNLD